MFDKHTLEPGSRPILDLGQFAGAYDAHFVAGEIYKFRLEQ